MYQSSPSSPEGQPVGSFTDISGFGPPHDGSDSYVGPLVQINVNGVLETATPANDPALLSATITYQTSISENGATLGSTPQSNPAASTSDTDRQAAQDQAIADAYNYAGLTNPPAWGP